MSRSSEALLADAVSNHVEGAAGEKDKAAHLLGAVTHVTQVGGLEAEGLITNVSGTGAAQMTHLAQDGGGTGMDDSKIGNPLTVDVSDARYDVSSGNIHASGLGGLPSTPNFPFDSNTVHAGQRVEVDSEGEMDGTAVAARRVRRNSKVSAVQFQGSPQRQPQVRRVSRLLCRQFGI